MALELVVKQLQQLQRDTEKELSGIKTALSALTKKPVGQKRAFSWLSKEARARISAAQKKRWALIRRQKKTA